MVHEYSPPADFQCLPDHSHNIVDRMSTYTAVWSSVVSMICQGKFFGRHHYLNQSKKSSLFIVNSKSGVAQDQMSSKALPDTTTAGSLTQQELSIERPNAYPMLH